MAHLLPLVLPLYLVRFRIGPLPTTLLEIYLLVWFLVALLGFGTTLWKSARQSIWSWRWPLIAWVLVSFASIFWSPSMITGLGLWRAYILEPVLVFVVLHGLRAQLHEAYFVRSMRLVILIVGFWAIAQFVTGEGIPHPWNVSIEEGRRATGPFPYPNALALFVVPIAAYLFARWTRATHEWWLLVSWAMALLATLFAKSDGGLLALLGATWSVLVLRKETRRLALGIAVFGIVLLLIVTPLRQVFFEQLTFSGWSGRVRTWTWTETWNMLQDRPLLGAGFGGYPIVFAPYHEKTFIEIFQYPHTILFNVWSETGLFGVFAFGWIIVTWVRKRVSLIMLAPLIAILIHGLVDVPYFKNDLALAFWLLAFLTTYPLDQKPENR